MSQQAAAGAAQARLSSWSALSSIEALKRLAELPAFSIGSGDPDPIGTAVLGSLGPILNAAAAQ